MERELPLSPEQKQHVSISQYAYDILVNDSHTFMGKKNLSGFISIIVSNYGFKYFENQRYEEEIDRISSGKNKSFKIRLRDELYYELYPTKSTWIGAKYHIRQGEFINGIIEDYARKSFFDRESIFYKDKIDAINLHVDSNNSKKGILSIELDTCKKVYVKPYRLSMAFEAPYHYLICLSSFEPERGYIPVSIRLSRIKSISRSLSSYVSGKITKEQRDDLERRIKNNKVPYIMGEVKKFIIKLSQDGMIMYNSIFHQRPMYDEIKDNNDGTVTLVINSTERQVTNYFYQFGEDAVVIFPQSTACAMYEKYKRAFESYMNARKAND